MPGQDPFDRGRIPDVSLNHDDVTGPAAQVEKSVGVDPDLVIGYPIDGGNRFVDAMARDVELPPSDGRSRWS
jgi:hypothetical protein